VRGLLNNVVALCFEVARQMMARGHQDQAMDIVQAVLPIRGLLGGRA
jgi:hypothetical protein